MNCNELAETIEWAVTSERSTREKSFVRERWLTAPQSSYSSAYSLLFSHKLNGGLYADLDDKIVGIVLRKAKGTEIIEPEFHFRANAGLFSNSRKRRGGRIICTEKSGNPQVNIYHLFERVTLKIWCQNSVLRVAKLECVFFEIACFDKFCRLENSCLL